jgi:hypothetical protein
VSWVVLISAVGMLMILRNHSPKFLAKIMWAVNGMLAFIAGAALIDTWLGQWVSSLIAGLGGWVGGWVGAAGGVVVGVALLLVAVLVVLDLLDLKADSAAIAGLIVMPLLIVAAAGGPVADAGSQLYAAAQQIGMSSLGQLVGG